MATEPGSDKPNSADSASGGSPPPRGQRRGKGGATTVVRYGAMGWVGEFTTRANTLGRPGSDVVVQTDRGIELGRQLDLCHARSPVCVPKKQVRQYVENSGLDFCRPNAGRVLREATPQDVDEHRRLNAHLEDDIEQCADVARELNLDMKVVTTEHLLGGERIVFYFRAGGRIDFRNLVKELAHRYRTRIEMRQVGARDEARLVADWEVCGRECCCKNFLKNLRPVNMRMAKLQKSTLDPAKVSGRCGRLRCCLRFENEGYQELQARMPRRGTRVATASAEGIVVGQHALTQLVTLRTDDQTEVTVPLEEITAFNLPKPTPKPPASEPARPREHRSGRETPADRRVARPARSTTEPPAGETA